MAHALAASATEAEGVSAMTDPRTDALDTSYALAAQQAPPSATAARLHDLAELSRARRTRHDMSWAVPLVWLLAILTLLIMVGSLNAGWL